MKAHSTQIKPQESTKMIEEPITQELSTAITAWAFCSYAYDKATEVVVEKIHATFFNKGHMLRNTAGIKYALELGLPQADQDILKNSEMYMGRGIPESPDKKEMKRIRANIQNKLTRNFNKLVNECYPPHTERITDAYPLRPEEDMSEITKDTIPSSKKSGRTTAEKFSLDDMAATVALTIQENMEGLSIKTEGTEEDERDDIFRLIAVEEEEWECHVCLGLCDCIDTRLIEANEDERDKVISSLMQNEEFVGDYIDIQQIYGDNNTCIGALSQGTSGSTFSNSTAIGVSTAITASNQIVIGRSSETVVIAGTTMHSGAVNISGTTMITGVCNTLQSSDTILPITFTATPSFSMLSGMVYNLTTSSTAITSLGFTNIPTTPQQTYVFTFVLNPSFANNAWWLKPPTAFISITAVGGSINTAVPLVGMSNVVLPISYTYMFQQITIVNTSTTITPTFMGFVSVLGF